MNKQNNINKFPTSHKKAENPTFHQEFKDFLIEKSDNLDIDITQINSATDSTIDFVHHSFSKNIDKIQLHEIDTEYVDIYLSKETLKPQNSKNTIAADGFRIDVNIPPNIITDTVINYPSSLTVVKEQAPLIIKEDNVQAILPTISISDDLRTVLNPEQSYFFKTQHRNQIIYEQSVFEVPISTDSNVTTISVIDTEYQDYISLQASMCRLSDSDFQDRGNYVNFFNEFKNELETNRKLDLLKIIKTPSMYSSFIAKNYLGEFDWNVFEGAVSRDFKHQSQVLLSTQIKNALSLEKGQIFLNPKIEEIRTAYKNMYPDKSHNFKDYPLLSKGFILLDELSTKGVESTITRFDEYEEYARESATLKTHNITLVTFFGVVDILKAFTDSLLQEDIKELIHKGKLEQDKRLKSVNWKAEKNSDIRTFNAGAQPKWIITHNGISYKVKISVIDATATHGLASLNDLFINSGIDNEYKKALDKYKSCMLEALILEPELYHEYALGDVRIYEALIAYNDKLKKDIYRSLNIPDYFKELKLTIGSTVNDLIQAKIFQKMGISPVQKDKMNEEQLKNFFASHTLLTSPQFLQEYSLNTPQNFHLFNGETKSYNRFLLAKCDGGRCHCYIPCMSLFSKHCTICDIDISGAYTSTLSNLNFYIGDPCIKIFPKQDKMSLRKFLGKYKQELGDDNYYIRVSGELENEQDLIVSFMDADKGLKWFKHKAVNEYGEEYIYRNLKHNLESTKNKILTMMIEDGAITPDILDLILTEFSPKQRDDFLDNIYVKAFIFYPPSMELSSPEEYKQKLSEHEDGIIEATYTFNEKYLDREKLRPFNHYIKIDYGTFIVDAIRTFRSIYKKKKIKSLDQLFKLIGNTIYGVNVSKHFPISNIILANNITGAVRCCIWYTEKALNLRQTITDGGIFDANQVPYPIYKKFDSLNFVRSYLSSNRKLTNDDKCQLLPITKDKQPIIYDTVQEKWLVDGQYYDEAGYKKIIANLALEHIQYCFPNNKLMNKMVRHLATDHEGFVITKKDGITPTYTEKKGNFTFEVKDFIKEASFTGQSNYSYINWKGEAKTVNRSYETKKNDDGSLKKAHTAFFLDKQGYLALDENFYKYTSPSEMVFNALKKDPSKVPLLPAFVLPIIIKTKDFLQSYLKTYRWTSLTFGESSHKIVVKPLFEISGYKFRTKEQYRTWSKFHDQLKNRYFLTFELFFLNEDGTCNVKLMNETIDNMIRQGVINPRLGDKTLGIKGLDPYNHLNRKITNSTKIYIESIKQAKRYHRLMLVGINKYLFEYSKKKNDNLEAIVYEHEIDYYDTDKYSDLSEYMHHELEVL